MAVYENKLTLDIGQFIGATKKAVTEAGKLPDDVDIKITAESADAIAGTKKVDAAVDQLPEEKEIKLSVDSEQAEASLGGFGEKLQGLGDLASGGLGGALSGALSSIPIPQVAAAGAAIGAVGAALGGMVSQGREANEALKNLKLQTGASAEEMAVLEDQASKAFKAGVGESVAEAITITGEFKRTLGDLVPDEFLGEAITRTNEFAKAIGVEGPELAGKLKSVAQQFGISYDEAMNIVAAASQDGVSDVGGLLDAFQEFAPNAKEAGLSASEFGTRLTQASKQGVKDLAKVGDGYKELNNRVKSGDLAAQVAAVGGPAAEKLQALVEQAEEGVITTDELIKKSFGAINESLAAGEINDNTKAKLQTIFTGSVGEDLGKEVNDKIFGEPLDTTELEAKAKQAGQTITDNIANQDPLEKLQRSFTELTTDIGKGLVQFYNNIIAPVITPIIDGFERIKEVITNAFSGGALDGASGFFDTIKKLVSGVLTVAVERIVSIIDIIVSTASEIGKVLSETFAPLSEAFSDLAGEGGDVSSVFDTLTGIMRTVTDVIKKGLAVAVKVTAIPLKLVVGLVTEFVGFLKDLKDGVVDVVVRFKDWLAGIEPLRAAIDGLVGFVLEAKDAVVGFAQGIGKALGIIGDAEDDAEANARGLADAQAELNEELEGTGDAAAKAAVDVNQLAANFNNAMTAAGSQLATFLAAAAGGARGFIKDAAAAQKALRKLEASADSVAFAIDPVRQQQVRALREQAVADTVALDKVLTASLIANAIDRDRALLKIQQDADARALDEAIKAQKTLISAGGAGLPEAKAQLDALYEERKRLALQQAADQKAIEGRAQAERLSNFLAAEGRIRDAQAALVEASIIDTDRQLQAQDTSLDTLTKATEARIKTISRAAEDEARGLVESLPEFAKGVEEIQFKLESGQIDADAAFAEINDLRSRLLNELLAVPGGEADEFAKRVQAVFTKAARDASDAAREISDAFKDSQVSIIRSDTIRAIEEQVRALEKQRDLLLLNANLTQEQVDEINKGFAAAIDKVRRGPVAGLDLSVKSIADTLTEARFDLDAEDAEQDAEAVQKQIDEINAALAAGEITYQQAIDQLRGLSAETTSFMQTLGAAFQQATAALAEGQRAAVDEQLNYIRTLEDERKRVQADTTLTAAQQAEQLEALNVRIADSQVKALDSIAATAGASFVDALAQAQNVGDALLATAGESAKALLALYIPNILALFASIIPPPFGLIAGGVAVAGLQALLNAALASFDKGGATGGRLGEVVGIVHGQEWVARPEIYKRNKALLDHLHDGGSAQEFFTSQMPGRMIVNQSGELAYAMGEIRETLGKIPALMEVREYQTVEVQLDETLEAKRRLRRARRSLSR